MDRKKPSLTSPWKVGFLVALLLVVTALGVSYFITGTFAVTWHWIHVGGLSPATWTFNLGAFFEEMVPLLVLTSLLALGAYVLVAGAVRRYKSYVDSGVEYKQLLKSIKSIEDLEDESLTDRLRQHPELREFLMGVRHRVSALERQQSDRKPAHSGTPSGARDDRPRLSSECSLLASAIASGRDAFSRDLALTVPELKQIERALRESFASAPQEPVAAPAGSDDLDALRDTVRTTAKSMRRDVDECTSGARELESALSGLQAALENQATPAPADTAAVQKRVDMTAEAIAALGEETRRIAIASAMQASGGPEADDIKVADELRTLATRFNTVAQHWRETASALKEALGAPSPAVRTPNEGATAAAAAISRARRWSERTIAMTEHVRTLERAVQTGDGEPVEPLASTPSVSTMDLAEDTVAPAHEPAVSAGAIETFGARSSENMFASDDDSDASFMDIPGFEKEKRFFADNPASNEGASDDRFVVDRADESRWDLEPEKDEKVVAQAAPAAPAPENGHDSDGFLTGPRPVVSPKKIERAAAPVTPRPAAPEPEVEAPTATATLDPDAVDLYELGAVDCVQTV